MRADHLLARSRKEMVCMEETLELLGEGLEALRSEASESTTQITGEEKSIKRFKPINRNQLMIRPVDIEKLVEEDHPVRAIWAMVCQLDWDRFEEDVKVVEGGKGRSSLDPRLLSALWIYAYSEGVNSARELSRMCEYEPGCQWLTGMQGVNYHTLADFRVKDKEAQDDLFKQVLGRLSAEGLTDLKRIAQDGTKIRAQASGNSFRREDTLREHLKLAEEQIQAMGSPDSEDASQREIKAKQRAIREKKQRLQQAMEELKKFQQDQEEKEKQKAPRVSETDPEARVMKQPDGGFAPSYNVQICTETSNKIIVAVETTQAGNDYDELAHGIDAVHANTGQTPEQMVVDGGYIKNGNIEDASQRGVDLIGPVAESNAEASLKKRGLSPEFYPDKFRYDQTTNTFTCPADKTLRFQRMSQRDGRREHQYRAKAADCHNCPFRHQCCPKNAPRMVIRMEDSEAVRAFKDKMQTEQARQIYRTRAEVAETPNAWIKDKFGLRQFRVRGLVKAGMEALWACLTYNIRQWMRLSWKPRLAAALAVGAGVSA
jgi:transposase